MMTFSDFSRIFSHTGQFGHTSMLDHPLVTDVRTANASG